ncbi:hypothetical protein [Streptomyces sp. Wb2n-11]|uniref:hypothetical protein n=1 Tax=Streptomyces sp. Wb2n-11 TaxID=1030533 RepID=UPI000A812532|nr:hypothetical protein [Streptomyces sp. Wb2n-11]
MNAVYAFIEAGKTTHPVALLCRLLKVARSSFYGWMAGEQARAARRREFLRAAESGDRRPPPARPDHCPR